MAESAELFHFDVDGKDYTLPKKIPSGALRKVRSMSNLDASYTLLELTADAETLAAHDTLEQGVALAILSDWMDGLTPGKSESSPTS